MGADAAVAVVCGAAMGAVCWMLFACGREEALATFATWRTAALMEMRCLLKAVRTIAARIGRSVGLRTERNAIGLGEISEMIDIVRLGLSAGLSFDAALGLYCDGRAGLLSDRMVRARLLWQTGVRSRTEALSEAAQDMGVHAMEAFAMAVGQALELGAPLAETLEGQSREIRAAHRAEVERQIERAPVKLLIPTGTLILPALLVSIIGPLLAAGGML